MYAEGLLTACQVTSQIGFLMVSQSYRKHSLHACCCKADGCQSEQLTVSSSRLSTGRSRMHKVHGEAVHHRDDPRKPVLIPVTDACLVQASACCADVLGTSCDIEVPRSMACASKYEWHTLSDSTISCDGWD